jgi:hypothetical protein
MVGVHNLGQYSISVPIFRLSLVNFVESLMQKCKSRFWVIALVDKVVGFSAKSIESTGRMLHDRWQ